MTTLVPTIFYLSLGIIAIAIAYMIAYRIAFLLAASPADAIAFDEFVLRCEHTDDELRSDLRGLGWIAILIRVSGTDEKMFREFVEEFACNVNRFRTMIRRLIATAVRVGFMGSLVGIIMLGSEIEIAFVSTAIITTLLGTLIEAKGELLSGLFAGTKTKSLLDQVVQTRAALQTRRKRQFLAEEKLEREQREMMVVAQRRAIELAQQNRAVKQQPFGVSKVGQIRTVDSPLLSTGLKSSDTTGGQINGNS